MLSMQYMVKYNLEYTIIVHLNNNEQCQKMYVGEK